MGFLYRINWWNRPISESSTVGVQRWAPRKTCWLHGCATLWKNTLAAYNWGDSSVPWFIHWFSLCHVQWNISSLKQPTPNSSPLSEGNLLAELNLKHPWIPSDSNKKHMVLNVIPMFLVRNVRTLKKGDNFLSWWQCQSQRYYSWWIMILWFWILFMTRMALLKKKTHSKNMQYCWWKKSCTTWDI